MFEELNFYLTHSVSPQRLELFTEAYNLLLRTEDQSFSDRLDTIIQLVDERGDTLTVLDIEICFRKYLDQVILAHGIIADDSDIRYQVAILKTLLELETYDDPEVIKATLDTDENGNPETALGMLAELITDTPWTDFLPIIESVSPSLIDRIKDVSDGRTSLFGIKGDDYEFSITPYLVRLRQFRSLYPNGCTLISQMLEDGMKLGGEPDTYVEEVLEKIDDLSKEDLLLEMVAIVLATKTPNENLLTVTSDTIDEFVTDDMKVMYVMKNLGGTLERIINS